MTEAPESGLTFLVSCFFVWLTWFQLFRNTPLTPAPSSTPVQEEEDPEEEYPEDLVDKGVYSQTYKKDVCESKCKIKTLKKDEADRFKHVTQDMDKGDVPLCFNHGEIESKCCLIEQDSVLQGCPADCFEEVQDKLNTIDKPDENRYKKVLNQNSYTNKQCKF